MAKKAKGNTKDRKLVHRFTEFLHVPLTDKELLTRADQLARCEKTLEELKAELAAQSSHLKKQIRGVEKDRARLSFIVASKKEERDVGVEEWHDFKVGELQRVRSDTKEIIYARKLETAEKQQSLPIAEKVKQAEATPVTDKPPAEKTQVSAGMDGNVQPVADLTKKRKKMPVDSQDIAAAHAPGRSAPVQPEPPRAA